MMNSEHVAREQPTGVRAAPKVVPPWKVITPAGEVVHQASDDHSPNDDGLLEPGSILLLRQPTMGILAVAGLEGRPLWIMTTDVRQSGEVKRHYGPGIQGAAEVRLWSIPGRRMQVLTDGSVDYAYAVMERVLEAEPWR